MSTVSVDRAQPRQYGDQARRYFSVSQVLRVMTGEDSYGSEADMQRGTDLHTIFALSVASYAGRCAPPVVPVEYQGYHQSMQWWIERWKPEPVHIERPSVSAMTGLPFAGTPDLLAWTSGNGKRLLSLVDLKSGTKANWHYVQVQAYQLLTGYQEATALRLLYVHADGSEPDYCSIKRNPRDFAAFHSALNLLLYRESL
jgi:hypothetical protein